jgi:peroxiredoxin
MRSASERLILPVVCCVLGVVIARADESARPLIGAAVTEFKFKDIRYLPRSLADFKEAKAIVVVFTNTTCPLAQKYWPKLQRLHEEYRELGVQFISVNSAPDDEIAEIAQQAIDYGVDFPLVKDTDGSCAKALGATHTPQAIVLAGMQSDDNRTKWQIIYRGRIDDQQRLGGARPTVTSDDLKAAIDDVLAGREVKASETPVDGCLLTLAEFSPPAKPVTFYEHVLPIVQDHCVECHRAGGAAPFALTTLDDVASQAEMIAEVVAERRMPPWFASRRQQFHNERGLSAAERETVVAWVKTGRTAGDEQHAPPPRTFTDSKWEIGEPDLVTTALETHNLPADGFVDYRYTVLPHLFLDDTWVSAVEILPSNPAVVHHANLAYWTVGGDFDPSNFITGRVPGGTPLVADDGVAFKIPKGSVIGLQIHYTTTGKPEKNRMSVGLQFPKTIVRQELHHVQVTTSRFAIPPGAAAHAVTASRTLPVDATGIGMFAHMHLRGKDMTFVARPPEGEPETLLSIPNYHYDWQQNYRWGPGTKKFAKGTKIEVTAHFDNSRFNPFNPDPTVTVKHGPQTVHEMMFGFFFYTADGEDLNLKVDPKSGRALNRPEAP